MVRKQQAGASDVESEKESEGGVKRGGEDMGCSTCNRNQYGEEGNSYSQIRSHLSLHMYTHFVRIDKGGSSLPLIHK